MSALQIIKENEHIALVEIFDPDWPKNPLRFHVVEIDRDIGLVTSAIEEDSHPTKTYCSFSVTGIRTVSSPKTRASAEKLFFEKIADVEIS